MNKTRRKQITNLIGKIEALKSDLEWVRDEEQEYFDNIPENLQTGIRAEESEEALSLMDDAIDGLDSAITELESIM